MLVYAIMVLIVPATHLICGELTRNLGNQVRTTTPRYAHDQYMIDILNKHFLYVKPSTLNYQTPKKIVIPHEKEHHQLSNRRKKNNESISPEKKKLLKIGTYLEESLKAYMCDQSESAAITLGNRINGLEQKFKNLERPHDLIVLPGYILRATSSIPELNESLIKNMVSLFRKLVSYDIDLFRILEDNQPLMHYALQQKNPNGLKALMIINDELSNLYAQELMINPEAEPPFQFTSIEDLKHTLRGEQLSLFQKASDYSVTIVSALRRMLYKKKNKPSE